MTVETGFMEYFTVLIDQKGSLYSITLSGGTCLANHWKYYPEPAHFTENSVKQSGGSCSALLSWEPVIVSPFIPNKRW